MSSGVGYINVQMIYQTVFKFDMPFTYDPHKAALIPNPKLKKRWKMPLWEIFNFLVIAVFVYCVIYEINIFISAEQASKINPELFIVYGFVLVTFTQQVVTFYTFERDPPGVTHMVTSAFKILGIKHIGLPTPDRLPDIPEIFCYDIATSFFNFTFLFSLYPFLRSYDPINTHLVDYIPIKLLRNTVASSFYGFITFYWAISCSSYILLAMSTCHAFETLTENILKLSKAIDDSRYNFHFDRSSKKENASSEVFWKKVVKTSVHNIIHFLSKFFKSFHNNNVNLTTERDTSTRGSLFMQEFQMHFNHERRPSHLLDNGDNFKPRKTKLETFHQVFRLHNQTRMLITVSNKSVEAFVPVMTGVGMSICITSNFAMIHILNYLLQNDTKIGDKQDIILVAMITGYVLECTIIGIIIFFCKHASQPKLHYQKYIHIWRNCQLLPSVERRQATAMSEICFMLGPFFKATEDTALRILYKILDFTTTLLLGLS